MPKTITTAMRAHLAEEVTTLASAWLITREDNRRFRFTTAAEDQTIDIGDGQGPRVYSATEGYNRTNINSDVDLNVSNLDIRGIFTSDQITEDDLRLGLFDNAEVRIFIFNYRDKSMGIIRMLRGRLGEVTVTPNGFFQVELRDLSDAFSKEFGEHYSKDCRADLGDRRCRLPIYPNELTRNQAVATGEFYRVAVPRTGLILQIEFDDGTAADTSGLTATPTLGSGAAVRRDTINALGFTMVDDGLLELSPSAAVDPAISFVEYPDNANYTIGTDQFTFETTIRFKDLTAIVQVIASQWLNTGNQRAWLLQRNGSNLEFIAYADGATAALTLTGAFPGAGPIINTNYHIAVSRDGANTVRLFIDGAIINSSVSTVNILNSTTEFRLGKRREAGGSDLPFNGFMDSVRFIVGQALYTAAFTAPTLPHFDGLTAFDFSDRIYRVTDGGTTAAIQPAYNTTVGQQTTDGGATLEAEEAWTRAFEVTSVMTDRRTFVVTELTPNTAGPRGGFPDQWFALGAVFFESGANRGRGVEVRTFTADDGVTIEQTIELFEPLPFSIAIGDRGRISPGCDKTFATCRDKFSNVINFVGEPYVPGQDILGRYPDAR